MVNEEEEEDFVQLPWLQVQQLNPWRKVGTEKGFNETKWDWLIKNLKVEKQYQFTAHTRTPYTTHTHTHTHTLTHTTPSPPPPPPQQQHQQQPPPNMRMSDVSSDFFPLVCVRFCTAAVPKETGNAQGSTFTWFVLQCTCVFFSPTLWQLSVIVVPKHSYIVPLFPF